MWSSYRDPDMQHRFVNVHRVLTYSASGLLIEMQVRENGIIVEDHRHIEPDVSSADRMQSSESSDQDCLPNTTVSCVEHPARNRKREVIFSSCDYDPRDPPSTPTYIVETTFDDAGRVVDEKTTSPILKWRQENPESGGLVRLLCSDAGPNLGHVVNQYDFQGHVIEYTFETDGGMREHISRSYDKLGNEISEHELVTEPNCVKTTCQKTGTTITRREFVYQYDQFGNWTSKATYTLNRIGLRGKPQFVEYQKLIYYPQ